MSTRASRVSRRTPTLSDVARRAGVSPMTVSRVINGQSNVSAETRDAVNAAVTALKYVPNPAARMLAGSRPLRIALLYSNPSAAYLSEFLVGSLEQASRGDVQLIVQKCDIEKDEVKVARRLVDRGIDAVVLPPPLCDSRELLDFLLKADIATAVVATGRPPAGAFAVTIDDHRAACDMTRHLLSLGHRRIGFIAGHPNQTASARRLEGYSDALAKAGVPLDPALVTQGLFTYRSGLEATERLLELTEPPTAIFASNDDMAAAAVAVAHRRGIDVPKELTVCGFDDTALATTIWPELTTIQQPIGAMASSAVELVAAAVRRKRVGESVPVRHQVLKFSLIRRQSDARPKKR